ncbi:MAG: prepilin-type N-terminal cleavage/methylation domain-containing protein [Chlorobium sp.]|nr:prepilin-type N-terminal cleavage/methylation domain-containing protein [Chlorobium sp.]
MKKNNSQNGFTLIEVLVAIALLTIGILGAATMQIASIDGNNTAMRLTGAVTWGEDELETLMGLPYAHADLDDDSNAGANAGVTGLDNTDVAGSLADGGPVVQDNFTVFWNVADDYPVFGTKTLRVIVRRNDKGVIKTVTQDFTKMRPI